MQPKPRRHALATATFLVWSLTRIALPDPDTAAGPDFSAASDILRRAVEDHAFPGCVAAVGSSRGGLWIKAFGRLDYTGRTKTDPSTLYDLASLTKVVGTTSVVLCLVRDGKLGLQDPVAKHVPEFLTRCPDLKERAWRAEVRVEHLLTHCAGLTAWLPFYRDVTTYTQLLDAVRRTPLARRPGTVTKYSDLGFILLGEIAARAGKKPLARLEQALVFEPLGLRETRRDPPPEWKSRIAPTERDGEREANEGDEHTRPFLHGVVHDENARAAGGVTGHAGLFSSARDLAVFARELLRCHRGEGALFPSKLLHTFTTRRNLVADSPRGLGWGTPTPGSSAGTLLSPHAFGHTGFTGTSIWLDPTRDLYIILLTNRVHPTRANHKISAVRRALADAIARAIDAEKKPPRAP